MKELCYNCYDLVNKYSWALWERVLFGRKIVQEVSYVL